MKRLILDVSYIIVGLGDLEAHGTWFQTQPHTYEAVEKEVTHLIRIHKEPDEQKVLE